VVYPQASAARSADGRRCKPEFRSCYDQAQQAGRARQGVYFQGGHFMTFNTDLNDLIAFAYGLHPKQIIDAPAWFATDLFDIEAKPDAEGRPSMKQMSVMAQKLLEDRFQLKFHHDKRELSVYVISVASGGPKMTRPLLHQLILRPFSSGPLGT